jgi:cell division septation protein DedD
MPDHEVHEIQLNGKQLVFMFMAATVVSVVIFLCGVMVGRGVRIPQADAILSSTDTTLDPTALLENTNPKSAPATDAAPAPESENLTYAARLEAPKPLNEPLKITESKAAVAPLVEEKPAQPKATAEQEPKPEPPAKTPKAPPAPVLKTDAVPASSSFAEPAGKGYVLQVQAFPTRAAADALAGRLKGKGYAAFVTTNPANARGKYRVRVGKFGTRREADAISARLKQEEHFEPWLTH